MVCSAGLRAWQMANPIILGQGGQILMARKKARNQLLEMMLLQRIWREQKVVDLFVSTVSR